MRYSTCAYGWTDPEFDCFADLPTELREIALCEVFEMQISNGGLPQLLWNTMNHWRVLLDQCLRSYMRMEFVTEAQAVIEFQELFERWEGRCQNHIRKRIDDNDPRQFSVWCEISREALSSPKEAFFYSTSDLDERRSKWIEARSGYFEDLVRKSPPFLGKKRQKMDR